MAAQKKQEEEEAAAAAAAGEPAKKKENPFEKKKDIWGGEVAEDVQLDPKKLMEALRKEDKRLKEGGKGGGKGGGAGGAAGEDGVVDVEDERKRGYNVNHEVDVTEEEMEAYRMKRQRKDDPMNDPGTKGYDLV